VYGPVSDRPVNPVDPSSPVDPNAAPVAPGTAPGTIPGTSAPGTPGAPGGPGGAPAGSPDPAKEKPPSIWIWQDSDDVPVKVKTKTPRRHLSFNPLTDTGFFMTVKGNASLGYDSQSQTASPKYTDLDSSIEMDSTGFIYNPQLLSFALTTTYNRNQMGLATRNNTLNGLWYGARLSLLSATMIPTTFSFSRTNEQTDGNLATPFTTDGRNMDLSGTVLRLPMLLNYRLGDGNSTTTDLAGRFLGYRYQNGSIAANRTWNGLTVRLGDDYLASKTDYDVTHASQINNYLHANVEKAFGSRFLTYLEAVRSKYNFGQATTQSTKADVTSVSGGGHVHATSTLDLDFAGAYTQNAVNMLQLISQTTTVPLPNPLPGAAVLDTRSRSFGSTVGYRPWKRWTFGGTANYTHFDLPESVIAATPVAEQPKLTSGNINYGGSVSYMRPIWKLDYSGGVSLNLQNQTFVIPSNLDGRSVGYGITNGVQGGEDDTVRYGVRFTITHANNPVFFDLLNSDEKLLDFDFSSRRFRLFHLTAKVEYRDQAITYAGSTQDQSGVNFMFTASRNNLDITVGRLTSDATAQYFGPLSPLVNGGGSTGVTPPSTLLIPSAISKSTSTTASVRWRIRHNLEFNSSYDKFAYTLLGDGKTVNNNTQWDNNITYKLGRFDIIGGYEYFAGSSDFIGQTGTYKRRVNLFYFKIKFPFVVF
jgi:hypothetical protein